MTNNNGTVCTITIVRKKRGKMTFGHDDWRHFQSRHSENDAMYAETVHFKGCGLKKYGKMKCLMTSCTRKTGQRCKLYSFYRVLICLHRFHCSVSLFNWLSFHIFPIFSLLNLRFFHMFHIFFSLFLMILLHAENRSTLQVIFVLQSFNMLT
jgi:hypothetical protein